MSEARISLECNVLKLGNGRAEDVLIGSKCRKCQRYFFPQRKICGYCSDATTDVVELSREGIINSFSLLTKKPKYSLIEAPYVLGEVKIPEGILIYTVIHETDLRKLKIGQKVKLRTIEVKKDESGNSILGYCFALC